MNMKDIEKYTEEHSKFEMFDFQERFSLSYAETNKTLEGLRKNGMIKYCDGFIYEVVNDAKQRKTEPIYTPKNEHEAFFIKVLWECIRSRDVSNTIIQSRLSCGYDMANRAIEWMEKNGYIELYPNRKVKMSVEEYFRKFGNPNKKQEESEDEERERIIRERRRVLMERLSMMTENADSDDEDEVDEDTDEQTRREYLEKRRAELITRMKRSFYSENDDFLSNDIDAEVDLDEKAIDLKSVLFKSLVYGLQENANDDKFILGFDGEPKYEFKLVNDDGALKISDGGKTLMQVPCTKRKVKNILKRYAPVILEDEEISITIENPYGTLMALLMLFSAIDAVMKMH